ncbi:LAQU0S01e01178g1_1 [Lachancea quebecensis]|uniref:LAQU0S01e01178g1_1 n=1 Tax=Lachancea quebecensis TaxID=1654605 RepID=A0A0P1KWM7_9SACH|nr:LAQU0S01e01178g1_1 [Lachancea quebecensis]
MQLEEVLVQKAKIEEFLCELAAAHHKYLLQIQNPGVLDRLRKDILTCFSDICRLLSILVAAEGEGSIRGEIDRLNKIASKLDRLNERERSLAAQVASWDAVSFRDAFPELLTKPAERHELNSTYRLYLDRYLDDVGVANTSLADRQETHAGYEPEPESEEPAPATVLERVALLQACKVRADRDISQLESLLAAFKKDRELVSEEIRRQENHIDTAKLALESDLQHVRHSQQRVLARLGITVKTGRQAGSVLPNFGISGRQEESPELNDQLDYANSYLEAKQSVLTADLKKFKDELHPAEHSRNTWEGSLSQISKLEASLKSILIKNPNTPPQVLSTEINAVVDYLEDASSGTSSSLLKYCLGSEIEVLKKANEELNPPNPKHSLPRSYREKGGTFLRNGTSRPQTGLNIDTVTSEEAPFTPTESPSVNETKMKKKE